MIKCKKTKVQKRLEKIQDEIRFERYINKCLNPIAIYLTRVVYKRIILSCREQEINKEYQDAN